MDQVEINDLKAFAEKMESNGDINRLLSISARTIADRKPDPRPNGSELMPESV